MGLGKLDMVLLIISLLASAAIGIFYSITGRKSTPLEYLLGGRNMKPLPLALSLMVGTVSAITILGNAGEMYAYGTQLWLMDIGILLALIIIAKFFIPVMYPLQLVSLYQYVEWRFKSKWLRQATVALQLVGAYLFIGFLMFTPSFALEQMTKLPLFANILIIGASCTLYSTFGGVKAVVYADTLQSIVMLIGVLAIVIQGAVSHGGIGNVYDIAYHGGRIEFFNFSLDPYQRHSLWLCITMGFFYTLSTNGVNQSQAQRYFSTGSVKNAQRVLYYSAVAMVVLRFFINLSGLVIYAKYKDCDPLIFLKLDAAVPIYYVTQELTKIPGLAGLFVAAIYAAVLSSVSTQLNSMTALIWEDFLKVLPVFASWGEMKVASLQKVIVFLSGVLGIVLGIAVSQMGQSLIRTVLAINGALSGPLIGLFFVALFVPWVPGKGATAGFVLSILFNVILGAGQVTMPKAPHLPMSYDGCAAKTDNITLAPNITMASITDVVYDITTTTTTTTTTLAPSVPDAPTGEWLFGLSYCLNSLWGTLLCVILSIMIAGVTGYNTPEDVDEKLINPTIWRLFKKSIKLQVKELYQQKILRKQNSGVQNEIKSDEETRVTEPLNNSANTKDREMRELESDGKGIV